MTRRTVVPTGLFDDDPSGPPLDEVAIVFPQETCKHHPQIGVMIPKSVLWSDDVFVISQGYACRKDSCNYTLKVLRDVGIDNRNDTL